MHVNMHIHIWHTRIQGFVHQNYKRKTDFVRVSGHTFGFIYLDFELSVPVFSADT